MVCRHPHVFGDVKAKNSKEVLKNWEQIKAEERAEKTAASDSAQQAAPVSSNASTAGASILADVPKSLPAALEAYQLTRRAARSGFDWDDLRGIFEKIDEEKAEIVESLTLSARRAAKQKLKPAPNTNPAPPDLAHLEEEVGDLLFAAVNVARFVGTD